jgi:hypothetical protein
MPTLCPVFPRFRVGMDSRIEEVAGAVAAFESFASAADPIATAVIYDFSSKG